MIFKYAINKLKLGYLLLKEWNKQNTQYEYNIKD